MPEQVSSSKTRKQFIYPMRRQTRWELRKKNNLTFTCAARRINDLDEASHDGDGDGDAGNVGDADAGDAVSDLGIGRRMVTAPALFAIHPRRNSVALSNYYDRDAQVLRQNCHVYRRRWYILLLFSLFSVFTCFIWNSLSPITYAIQLSYGWSDGTIALLINWSPIAIVLLFIPFSFAFERFGTRKIVLLGNFTVSLGMAVRAIFKQDPLFLISCHIGHFLNGAACLIPMSLPSVISLLWFPDNERILATSFSQSCFLLGSGLASIVGPLAVPLNENFSTSKNASEQAASAMVEDIKVDIHAYMAWMAVTAAVLFLLTLIYFPDAPPLPPSPNAILEEREDGGGGGDEAGGMDGWRSILSNLPLLSICLAYALPGAVQFGFEATLALQFAHLHITAFEVGLIGFLAICGQVVGVFVLGLAMDHLRSHIKTAVVILLAASAASFTWLALLGLSLVPFDVTQLCVATVAGTVAFFSCMPLFFELSLMISYPLPEALIGTYLTAMLNLLVMVFLFIMMLPVTDYKWVNYVLVGTSLAGLLLICLTKKPRDYVQFY